MSLSVSLQSEDGSEQTHLPQHHDDRISVRHIVIEIEAISHSAFTPSSPPSSSPSPPSSSLGSQEVSDPSALAHGSSPLSPSSQVGSVRRATTQLEQKMKQEQALAQCSPLHSPDTEQPPLPSAPHPAEHALTQEDHTAAVLAETKEVEERRDSDPHIGQLSGASPDITDTSSTSNMLTSSHTLAVQLDESSLDTSAQSASQSLQGPVALNVEGVTVGESETEHSRQDDGASCGPGCEAQSRLAHSSQELERIQQTLRELQAFLQEGVGPEATDGPAEEPERPRRPTDTMDTESGLQRGSVRQRQKEKQVGRGLGEPPGWHRAVELEARMRQAGLTPPSLMKRSASLAKLDSLELSANDLCDLDLGPHSTSLSSSSSHSQDSSCLTQSHPDDTWKKQKVLSLNCPVPPDDMPSPPHRSSSSKEDQSEGEETGSVASASQQGRGHSSRRPRKASAERKRAITLLYNTM